MIRNMINILNSSLFFNFSLSISVLCFVNQSDSRLDCSNFGQDDNYPQVAFQTDLSI